MSNLLDLSEEYIDIFPLTNLSFFTIFSNFNDFSLEVYDLHDCYDSQMEL